MNIGILYPNFDDTCVTPLFYPLTNGDIELLNGEIQENSLAVPTKFKIKDSGIQYHFSTEIDEIDYCDIKVLTVSIETNGLRQFIKDYRDSVKHIFICSTNGEIIGPQLIPTVEEFLRDPKVIFFAGHEVPEFKNHPRVIVDLAINLYFFYNGFGYYYLNYYPRTEKEHLLGVYHRFSNYKAQRLKTVEYLKQRFDLEIYKFDTGTPFFTEISGKILDRWSWQRMHMTSYLDYNTCVANIIFETRSGWSDHDTFTEKTLKSIIFQKADIFFIYVGTTGNIEWLHEHGFWFLNSEFYEKENVVSDYDIDIFGIPEGIPIYNSVIKSVQYLKTLKEELGSDEEVYKFLINKYRDKLDANAAAFKKLLDNCEYKQRLINMITE